MNISRISKAVAEVRGDQKFKDADDVRCKDIDLILPLDSSNSVRKMAQTAVALILRCFRGAVRIHSGGSDPLLRLLLENEGKKVEAVKRLNFDSQELGPWRLAIGCKSEGAVSADASGWTARINRVFEQRMAAAAPAITFGVACAVAKLFNRVIFGNEQHTWEQWDFCLLRFTSESAIPEAVEKWIDLGDVGLLGAGAIGSAVGFVLSISSWSGRLAVIDFDTFEEPNLETCISSDLQSVRHPLRKATGLARIFQGHSLSATEHHTKVMAGDPIFLGPWNAFVCAVDNAETRLILDDVNSRVLLNAGLGDSKEEVGWTLWTRHGHGKPTLSSIYKDSITRRERNVSGMIPEEFREECSRKSYQGVSLALPFVALAAASLLVAGLCQSALNASGTINFLQIDLFGKQQKMTTL